jgi:cell division septum initiation protein DivIVA
MSKPIITKQMLIDADACPSQVDLFEKTFGDSVIVTVKRAEKVAALFDWEWSTRLLDRQGRAEYKRVTAAARAEYDRVMTPASAEFKRVEAPALAEYARATAPAGAEYDRATATAGAEYDRARAAALAEYDRAAAPAWATAFIDMHKRGVSK